MSTNDPGYDKEKSLMNAVFSTPQGRELLEVWMEYHVLSTLQHEDVNVTHNRLGKRDFVVGILNALGK